MSAHLDPRDLGEVRRRVAEPVVGSVIRPDERGEVLVYTEDGDVYVCVMARGELVVCAFLGPLTDGPWDPVEKGRAARRPLSGAGTSTSNSAGCVVRLIGRLSAQTVSWRPEN